MDRKATNLRLGSQVVAYCNKACPCLMSLVVILAQGFTGVGSSLISVRGVRVGSTLATSVACLASRLFVVRCGATLRKELLPKGHHSYWSLPICNKPAHRYSLQGMSCGYITSGCTVDLIALGVASSANIIDIKHHERCLDRACMCECCVLCGNTVYLD